MKLIGEKESDADPFSPGNDNCGLSRNPALRFKVRGCESRRGQNAIGRVNRDKWRGAA
jgi:hypothetical protein